MNILIKREQSNECIGSAEREKFGAKLNTKNIFKTLAFAMMMPAMLLTTACSSSEDTFDDIVPPANENPENPEAVSPKGYTIPVTVNVTRQGDGTRATYDEDTKQLSFSAGDKLFVKGWGKPWDAGKFAGTLDYVPGSDGAFRGYITTQYEWYGTAEALFMSVNNNVSATLLPAGYTTYNYFAIDVYYDDEYYDADVVRYPANAFANSKATAVEQFSYEQAEEYSDGFALEPENPILNFTITDLTPNTEVDVVYSYYIYTMNRKVTTDASGKATFAIALGGTEDLNSSSLTVDGNFITLVNSKKMVVRGRIYNITRSIDPLANVAVDDNGKLIDSEELIYGYGNLEGRTYGADW